MQSHFLITTEKKIWGGQGGNRFTEKVESVQNANSVYSPKKSEALADEYGVNPSTILRDSYFTRVVDMLPEKVKGEVLSGSNSLNRSDAPAILKMDKPTQKKFIKEKNGITFLTICAVKKSLSQIIFVI